MPGSESTAISIIPKNKIIKSEKKLRKQTKILLIAIISVILVGAASAATYMYFAAPALQYEEALQLQAEGKYQQAIKKYEALGDYKDSKNMIWECYIGIGDDYSQESDFEKALKTYNIALKQKESKELYTKIWKCYIGIGDRYFDQKDFEKALETYYTAIDQKDSKELQDKINKTKMAYIETYKGDRTAKVEQFLSELKALKYPGIDKIYDAYYAWHVKITANTSEEDYSTDISTASRKDTIYFHMTLSGGEPSEQIQLYYEVIWPNGSSQISALDSNWKTGSKITARFQYPVPLFGKEGKLTFKLYDKSTNEELGSDSVTLQK